MIFEHLCDNVVSVRANSALSIVQIIKIPSLTEKIKEKVLFYINENL